MITFHHANTRGHVSFFAAPDTDHTHKFPLTHLIYFSCLSDSLTFTQRMLRARARSPTHHPVLALFFLEHAD